MVSDAVDSQAAESTSRAAELADAGDRAGARAQLERALRADPGHESAWRSLATLVDTDEERRFCLERAQEVRHDRHTARRLKRLHHVRARPPREVAWLVGPGPESARPPAVVAAPGPPSRRPHRRWVVLVDLGDPTTTATGTYYSQYVGEIGIHRDTGAYLVRNLLQLGLLVLITYLVLYFPRDSTDAFAFLAATVTGAAVMLLSAISPLPDVDYTVAIEWAYYAFILLAALCTVTVLVDARLAGTSHERAGRRLVLTARVLYPTYVLAIVVVYFLAFG
ncbi:hypothetical protein ACIQMJ_26405 [Actinosynnema sp. NPDC091369]